LVVETEEPREIVRPAELRIRTPEGITFAYQLAGPVTRCLAWVMDGILIYGLSFGMATALAFSAMIAPDFTQAVMVIGFFVISVAYGIVFEWFWRGQTVGKRIFRLRVMDADGLRLQFHQVVMRNLVRFADLLPALYMVGGIACLISRKAQRLGDLAAGTVVVHHRKPREPDLEQLLGGKFNSLRMHPHLCARLRQRTSPEEARIALQALLRRDEFNPAARVRLFAELAEHFRSYAEFPPDVLEGVPDEQFVRNIVDVLFRTSGGKSRPDVSAAPAPAPAAA
jgi:uncharacterized RDD family membrane protein YckC